MGGVQYTRSMGNSCNVLSEELHQHDTASLVDLNKLQQPLQ